MFSAERALTVHSPAIPEWSGRPALVPLQLSGSEGINELTANRIEIKGQEEVLMNGGGSWQRWAKEGISRGTSGSHTLHAARHDLNGPKSAAQVMQEHPQPSFDDPYVLTNTLGDPLPNTRVRVVREDGSMLELRSDARGQVPELRSLLAEGVQLLVQR
jgi:uncharacterized protein (DUF2345 family)